MLAQLYCLKTRFKGAKSLILSSRLSSASLWKEETHRLIRSMSKEDQKAIGEAEKNNDYTAPKFQEALDRYLKMTVSDYSKDDPNPLNAWEERKIWEMSLITPLGVLVSFNPLATSKTMKSRRN